MERRIPFLLGMATWLLAPAAASAPELQVEIHEPAPDALVPATETHVEVAGGASIYGGVRYLDLFLVMDTSKSLRRTDSKDHRRSGAVGLVRSLPDRGDIRVGVVDFDGNTDLLSPLTQNRQAVVAALEDLDQEGTTDIAEGIRTALRGFEAHMRVGASRVILLFTDGKSDGDEARQAMAEARERGVAIHTLLLGGDDEGEVILREIASGTGGSFVRVVDPERLPEAFLNLRTTGVESVVLHVDGLEPIPVTLVGGQFRTQVPVKPGQNRIVATALSLAGEERQAQVDVMVASGCGELQVAARRGGEPTLSISERSVEIVFDASNSMWGRMEGEPKISVAKQILGDALTWLPQDLALGLRVYGHQHAHAKRDCRDSELLVPFAAGSRDSIRRAIEGFRPRGQTPLAYSIEQAAADFAGTRGERALVLVTDGIESCGGDPVTAARALQEDGSIPVHVIGFGLGSDADEDAEALRAIAEASGGRFFTAGSAEELREALAESVGTPFAVVQGETTVARGTLGSDEVFPLPEGEYTVRLESQPPYEVPVSLASQQGVRLTLERQASQVRLLRRKEPIGFKTCDSVPAAPAP